MVLIASGQISRPCAPDVPRYVPPGWPPEVNPPDIQGLGDHGRGPTAGLDSGVPAARHRATASCHPRLHRPACHCWAVERMAATARAADLVERALRGETFRNRRVADGFHIAMTGLLFGHISSRKAQMDMSLFLSLASLFLSVLAFITSTLLLMRQTVFMRHANEMPVTVDLYQELRSAEFQSAQDYVLQSLPKHDQSLGFSNLPDEARISAYRVAAFYTSLGALVALKVVDERFVVSILSKSVFNRVWKALYPYIVREREILDGTDFLAFYEDLKCRVDDYPLAKSYGIKLRKVTDGDAPKGRTQIG